MRDVANGEGGGGTAGFFQQSIQVNGTTNKRQAAQATAKYWIGKNTKLNHTPNETTIPTEGKKKQLEETNGKTKQWSKMYAVYVLDRTYRYGRYDYNRCVYLTRCLVVNYMKTHIHSMFIFSQSIIIIHIVCIACVYFLVIFWNSENSQIPKFPYNNFPLFNKYSIYINCALADSIFFTYSKIITTFHRNNTNRYIRTI